MKLIKFKKMKRFFLTLALVSFAFWGFSQENLVNVTGGYAWLNIDDSDYYPEDPNIKGTGWRINGTYDFNPNEGKVAYGFSIGYVSVGASYDGAADTADYKISSIPVYFAPKFLFGNEKIKGFLKLMIGGQSSTLKRTGTATEASVSDFGFYGGTGAGFMYFVNEKIFLNAEYELAYATNGYYKGGLFQSASAGIGMRF